MRRRLPAVRSRLAAVVATEAGRVAEEWVAEAGSAEVVVVVGLEAGSDVFANGWIVLYVFVPGRYRVPIRRF